MHGDQWADLERRIGAYNAEWEKHTLSPLATRNGQAQRERAEEEDVLRPPFFRDADRILHSKAYTRFIDKTQVFYLFENDHITHRVLHVQLAAKIAREIGRCLRLNEDLIEAIALGHDIGHAPFGHEGEHYLSALCERHGLVSFQHNLHSVRMLRQIENGGEGCNLTLQTLDGILCHDGEVHRVRLAPRRGKTWTQLETDIERKLHDPSYPLMPMTLEGCVVRMADVISYIGRDIEDAITIQLIRREDLPREAVDVLGNTNRTIVNTLVRDLVHTSYGQDFVAFSEEVSGALKQLRTFNYERIYLNPKVKSESEKIQRMFETLFQHFLEDLRSGDHGTSVVRDFLSSMNAHYQRETPLEGIVRDFIAGMTDDYFRNQFEHIVMPKTFGYHIEQEA